MGLFQTKKFLHNKNKTINKMKSQPPEWEKIFANHMSDKGLMSKTYTGPTQLNLKNPI